MEKDYNEFISCYQETLENKHSTILENEAFLNMVDTRIKIAEFFSGDIGEKNRKEIREFCDYFLERNPIFREKTEKYRVLQMGSEGK